MLTTDINWTAAGAWASFFALLGIIVRQWVPWRKLRQDEFKMVTDVQAAEIQALREKITSLESKMDDQRDHYERLLNFQRECHDAEIALHRHATKNAKQILYGMLDLVEAAPEKASEHATKMRAQMIEKDKEEAAEAAKIRSARIIAAGQGDTAPMHLYEEHL